MPLPDGASHGVLDDVTASSTPCAKHQPAAARSPTCHYDSYVAVDARPVAFRSTCKANVLLAAICMPSPASIICCLQPQCSLDAVQNTLQIQTQGCATGTLGTCIVETYSLAQCPQAEVWASPVSDGTQAATMHARRQAPALAQRCMGVNTHGPTPDGELPARHTSLGCEGLRRDASGTPGGRVSAIAWQTCGARVVRGSAGRPQQEAQ